MLSLKGPDGVEISMLAHHVAYTGLNLIAGGRILTGTSLVNLVPVKC